MRKKERRWREDSGGGGTVLVVSRVVGTLGTLERRKEGKAVTPTPLHDFVNHNSQ